MSAKDVALTKLAEAKVWADAAASALNTVIGFGGRRSEIDGLPQFKGLKTHFHVTLGPAPGVLDHLLSLIPFVEADPTLVILKDLRVRYWQLSGALSKPEIFRDSPAEGEGKKATAFVPMIRDGTIRITPNYLKIGPLNQVLVLVHEAAHFLSDAFQDFSYRDRTGEDDPNKYINLPMQFAIRNADSYAYYALQMAKGIERILKLSE